MGKARNNIVNAIVVWQTFKKKSKRSIKMFVVRRVLMEYVWLCAVMTESERTLTRMLSKQNQAHAPPTLFD